MPNIAAEPVHVAVAVIVRDGRVLLSKRAEHVHQGSLWEFPGGKVESGETALEALSREIKEELGLDIISSQPLIKIVHHYADKTVLLETYLVTEFAGIEYAQSSQSSAQQQTGLEGQAVVWTTIEQLGQYQFPAANKPIISALTLPDRYYISPDCQPEAMDAFIEQFIAVSNQGLVQLRLPSLRVFPQQLKRIILRVNEIAQVKQIRLMLNSSLYFEYTDQLQTEWSDLLSGIHLTSCHLHELHGSDFIQQYRQQWPQNLIAASCHNQQDIEVANRLALDFVVLSPVQKTTSHPEQAAMGWRQFNALTALAKMPVFALGGMRLDDIPVAQNNGAQGIAAIRSLWQFNTGNNDGFDE